MSFLYQQGDDVVVVTRRSGARTAPLVPLEAKVLERQPAPAGRLFPYYRVLIQRPRGKAVGSEPWRHEDWLTEHEILGLASEYRSPTHRYYQVIAHEPLLTYFRVPLPLPPNFVRKAMMAVMKDCHVKQKDIVEITYIEGTEDAEQARIVKRLARVYAGDRTYVPGASFYDWHGAGFGLARGAVR